MKLLKLEHKTINLDAVALIEVITKGRLLVTFSCGKETIINTMEALHVRRELNLDKKPIVYLPPIESYLSPAEQKAWSFIQGNEEEKLSIGRINEHLASGDQVEVLGQTQDILKRLEDFDLIKIEHAYQSKR